MVESVGTVLSWCAEYLHGCCLSDLFSPRRCVAVEPTYGALSRALRGTAVELQHFGQRGALSLWLVKLFTYMLTRGCASSSRGRFVLPWMFWPSRTSFHLHEYALISTLGGLFCGSVGRAVQEDGVQRFAQEEEPGIQVYTHAGRAQGGTSSPCVFLCFLGVLSSEIDR